MRASHAVVTVSWASPPTRPPEAIETLPDGRTLRACTILDPAQESAIVCANAIAAQDAARDAP